MYAVTVRDHVMIAHSLPRPVFGPAQGLHGATYVVEATFRRASSLDDDGIVVDIGAATSCPRRGAGAPALPEPRRARRTSTVVVTTTEVLTRWVSDRLAESSVMDGLDGLEVVLRESPDAWASYTRDAMRLRFVVPADVAAPTGGNVYDLAAAAALRRSGVEVDAGRGRSPSLADCTQATVVGRHSRRRAAGRAISPRSSRQPRWACSCTCRWPGSRRLPSEDVARGRGRSKRRALARRARR